MGIIGGGGLGYNVGVGLWELVAGRFSGFGGFGGFEHFRFGDS